MLRLLPRFLRSWFIPLYFPPVLLQLNVLRTTNKTLTGFCSLSAVNMRCPLHDSGGLLKLLHRRFGDSHTPRIDYIPAYLCSDYRPVLVRLPACPDIDYRLVLTSTTDLSLYDYRPVLTSTTGWSLHRLLACPCTTTGLSL